MQLVRHFAQHSLVQILSSLLDLYNFRKHLRVENSLVRIFCEFCDKFLTLLSYCLFYIPALSY